MSTDPSTTEQIAADQPDAFRDAAGRIYVNSRKHPLGFSHVMDASSTATPLWLAERVGGDGLRAGVEVLADEWDAASDSGTEWDAIVQAVTKSFRDLLNETRTEATP